MYRNAVWFSNILVAWFDTVVLGTVTDSVYLDYISVALLFGSLTVNSSTEGFKIWVLKVSTVLHAGRLKLFSIGGSLANFWAF